ncbi:hypothetical protein J8M14_11215 [Aquimarina sp. MMG016]|nr:hypothetical protein [Aquimarina sp. MMG016]
MYQNDIDNQQDVSIGDILTIGKPSAQQYHYIHFPKTNFIIKRGGVANYKNLKGKSVVVTKIETSKDGKTIVTIKRKDGARFFGTLTTVKADLKSALDNKEIIL